MDFEFDPNKSASNKIKHGIDFIEAQALWQDKNAIEFDINNIKGEERVLIVVDILLAVNGRGFCDTGVASKRSFVLWLLSHWKMPSPVGLLQQVDSISWGNPSMARPHNNQDGFLSLGFVEL